MTDPDDPAEHLLTPAQAATAAHVTSDVITTWRRRGLITPLLDMIGTWYRELDVLQAEASTRRAPRSRALLDEAATGIDLPTA